MFFQRGIGMSRAAHFAMPRRVNCGGFKRSSRTGDVPGCDGIAGLIIWRSGFRDLGSRPELRYELRYFGNSRACVEHLLLSAVIVAENYGHSIQAVFARDF